MASVQPEISMQSLSRPLLARHHPLAVAAAASVIVVSLVYIAAILGWLPSSNGKAMPSTAATAAVPLPVQQPMTRGAEPLYGAAQAPAAAPLQVNATRLQTVDGRTFEEVILRYRRRSTSQRLLFITRLCTMPYSLRNLSLSMRSNLRVRRHTR
jgi:hypothetical protein